MRLHSFLIPILPSIAVCRLTERATITKRDDAPPYGSVKIRNVQTSGSGCPPGSVSIQISLDMTTVTIGMTKMGAYFGPEYRSSDNLRNCEIHVDMTYPGGYQFSIMTATYNGYARLDPGVIGQLTASYFFSQSPNRIKYSRTQIDGPQYELGNPFQKVDTANDKSIVLSPCGSNGMLNVNDILSISSRNRSLSGELNVFDATISFTQKLFVRWYRCGSEDFASTSSGGMSSGSEGFSSPGGKSSTGKSSSPKGKSSSSGGRPSGGRPSSGKYGGSQVSLDEPEDEDYEPVEATSSYPRDSTGTFTPTVYSNDIGDLRNIHELTDLKSTLKSDFEGTSSRPGRRRN